jgi:hypothetical protein
MTRLKWLPTLALVIRMESSELGCDREGTAGPSATLGMTRLKWLPTLALVIRMESSELGCDREGTAGPSASLGMTKFRWLADLGTSYSDGGVRSLVATEREQQVPRLRSG